MKSRKIFSWKEIPLKLQKTFENWYHNEYGEYPRYNTYHAWSLEENKEHPFTLWLEENGAFPDNDVLIFVCW